VELTHTFTVPAPVAETWAAFEDIRSVAECFPGATVTSVEGDGFSGACKVKLGPIALTYNGSGRFVEKDESAHRFVVDAKGKDKRGNGTAGATVTATFTAAGDATDVSVLTDLAITGKPAQFGRGMIQDVSDKLLQQFVDCLQRKVGSAGAGAPVEPAAATSTDTPIAAEASAAAMASGGDEAGGRVSTSQQPIGAGEDDDALDLGATVLPVLAKMYWKQALGVLLVLVVLKRLLSRHNS
jgi:uncharacterized protein